MSKPVLIFILVLLIATIGALVYIKNPRPYKIAWANSVLGHKEHYLDCSDLPFYPQVEKAIASHQDILGQLRNLEGVASVEPQAVKCYTLDGQNYFNKGDIVVEYSSRQSRQAVEKAIGDNFFGIPWRGYNR